MGCPAEEDAGAGALSEGVRSILMRLDGARPRGFCSRS